MHLILTGATGLIGSAVLQHMLTTPSITRISILSRRPVQQAEGHTKAEVILHSDFNKYPSETLAKLNGAEGVVWALGISQTAVSKEEYEKITYDYTIAAAKAFKTLPPPPTPSSPSTPSKPFKFIYVSGEGSTLSPGYTTPRFGIVKGRAESSLLSLLTPSFSIYSVRAGGPDPTDHPEIHPYLPQRGGMMKVMEEYGLPVVRRFFKGMLIPTRDLARVLTDLAMGDGEKLSGRGVATEGEGRILQNAGIRRLAGLD